MTASHSTGFKGMEWLMSMLICFTHTSWAFAMPVPPLSLMPCHRLSFIFCGLECWLALHFENLSRERWNGVGNSFVEPRTFVGRWRNPLNSVRRVSYGDFWSLVVWMSTGKRMSVSALIQMKGDLTTTACNRGAKNNLKFFLSGINGSLFYASCRWTYLRVR